MLQFAITFCHKMPYCDLFIKDRYGAAGFILELMKLNTYNKICPKKLKKITFTRAYQKNISRYANEQVHNV